MVSKYLLWFFFGIQIYYSYASLEVVVPETNAYYDTFMNPIEELSKQSPLDQCLLDYLAVLQAVKSEEWAQKMIDASSKLQSGIFDGNIFDMGNFDECILTHNPNKTIQGKYCFMQIMFKSKNLTNQKNLKRLRMANMHALSETSLASSLMFLQSICVPHTCTGDNITHILRKIIPNPIQITVAEALCTIDEEYNFRPGDWVTIGFVVVFIIWTLLCTIFDALSEDASRFTYLRYFSLYKNGSKLFNISSNNPRAIHCLNGMRVISICWIMIGHRFFLNGYVPSNINALDTINFLQSYPATLITGATVSVDTFFVLSGLLLTISFLRQLEKSDGRIPWIYFYVHRYIRLTVGLLVVVVFAVTVVKYFGRAPFWNFIIDLYLQHSCLDYWWSALLYVQNYVNPMEVCIGSTWYLSVDMQLYILSPLLLYPMWRWKWSANILLPSLLVIGHIIVFVIVYTKEIQVHAIVTIGVAMEEVKKWNGDYYQQTHMRAVPWVLGVWLGYFIHKRTFPMRINKALVAVMWIVSLALCVTVVVGIHPFVQNDSQYDKFRDSMYLTFSRTAWSIGICWVILACHSGYGGPINWFLSLKMWLPLCRISYAVYLIHLIQQAMKVASTHTGRYFTPEDALFLAMADIVFSGVLATLMFLIFECPMFHLEDRMWKALLNKRRQSKVTPAQ